MTLNFLPAVLRETLRLAPSAPKRGVVALEDTVIGGEYAFKANVPMVLHVSMSMRDPSVYGEDVRILFRSVFEVDVNIDDFW